MRSAKCDFPATELINLDHSVEFFSKRAGSQLDTAKTYNLDDRMYRNANTFDTEDVPVELQAYRAKRWLKLYPRQYTFPKLRTTCRSIHVGIMLFRGLNAPLAVLGSRARNPCSI